jgi:hypothetical protein
MTFHHRNIIFKSLVKLNPSLRFQRSILSERFYELIPNAPRSAPAVSLCRPRADARPDAEPRQHLLVIKDTSVVENHVVVVVVVVVVFVAFRASRLASICNSLVPSRRVLESIVTRRRRPSRRFDRARIDERDARDENRRDRYAATEGDGRRASTTHVSRVRL